MREETGSGSPPRAAEPRVGSTPPGGRAPEGFRAGFVALLGLPNVGKSTLLNRLVGHHLSIVTAKPQTTRRRLLGIHSDDRHQAIFVDTPGLLEPRYLLQSAMLDEAHRAMEEADLLLYVVDAGYPRSVEAARDFIVPAESRAILCLNKVDRVQEGEVEVLCESLRSGGWDRIFTTVATEGRGVASLRDAVRGLLPLSPPFYPTDELATAPVRYLAGELVRETCFELLSEEVPYAVAVRVEEFKDRGEGKPTYISAYVYVERASQKKILIGRGGGMIREIGTVARRKIEALLDGPVYLDLRVKVLPNWRKKRNFLNLLGFRTPPDRR